VTGYRLEEKFLQAEVGGGPAFLRVSAAHPIDLFVGTEDGRRALLLLCDQEPPEVPLFEAITVSRRQREDGRWALLISLERRDLSTLFAYLAEDLILTTEQETRGHHASERLVERLKWWQRLLSRGQSGVLGNLELRGLVGELLFLRDLAIPAFGPRSAVEAWVGPLEAPRDFRFAELDVEVKTLTRDAPTIRISSIEQLERAGAPILLATMVLESAADKSGGAISVQSIVEGVKALCEPDADVVAALSQRLWAAGYIERPEYESLLFLPKAPVFYVCSDEFPRISRTEISEGIVQCVYQISIASIARFHTTDWRQDHERN
jgi:Putative  PD-(D/E)XK family member, (DUF4420)